MKEQWRVIHLPFPSYNEGYYLASSYKEAVDMKWQLYRDALEHGCRRSSVQRIQKLVGEDWVDEERLAPAKPKEKEK